MRILKAGPPDFRSPNVVSASFHGKMQLPAITAEKASGL